MSGREPAIDRSSTPTTLVQPLVTLQRLDFCSFLGLAAGTRVERVQNALAALSRSPETTCLRPQFKPPSQGQEEEGGPPARKRRSGKLQTPSATVSISLVRKAPMQNGELKVLVGTHNGLPMPTLPTQVILCPNHTSKPTRLAKPPSPTSPPPHHTLPHPSLVNIPHPAPFNIPHPVPPRTLPCAHRPRS
jgi:hypothetical protein